MRVAGALIVIVAGIATTFLCVAALADTHVLGYVLFLESGPAWALAFCLVSTDSDFTASPSRTRDEWLRVLPWTFLLAPLLVPNAVLMLMFIRDARADSGRSYFSWDRMRPGDGQGDHHWPD